MDNTFFENEENQEGVQTAPETETANTVEESNNQEPVVTESQKTSHTQDQTTGQYDQNQYGGQYNNQYNNQYNHQYQYGNSGPNNVRWNGDHYYSGANPIRKKKSGAGKKIVAAVAVVMVGALSVGTYQWAMDHTNSSSGKKTYTKVATTDTSNQSENKVTVTTSDSTGTTSGVYITDVSEVVNNVMPSIVAITSTTIVSSGNYGFNYYYFGDNSGSHEETGAGSGIIIAETDTELLIVTNNHVVEGADTLSIQFNDDTTVEASVKGTDSEADLAIVAISLEDISEDTLNKIKIATLGNSDALEVGDGVIAIGNALGYGQSVTTGVVSALDREVKSEEGESQKMIQTDAAINGGNSGGALLNAKGEVIGINAAKYSSSGSTTSASIEGMGFAIPISQATDIINDLMNQKTKTKVDEDQRGAIGIAGMDVSEMDSEKYGIPVGVYVSDITSGGGAEKAGMSAKSIITAINGTKVSSMSELKAQLEYYAAGETVTLTVEEAKGGDYVEKEYDVTLTASNK